MTENAKALLIEQIRQHVQAVGWNLHALAEEADLDINQIRHLQQPFWNPDDETLRKVQIVISEDRKRREAGAADLTVRDRVKIFCAIDTPDRDRASYLAGAMAEAGCGVKFGLEYFTTQGPEGVLEIRRTYPDVPVFLDLKFHDIPNTVAGAVKAAVALRPEYLNVHVSGGTGMMRAAAESLQEEASRLGVRAPVLLGVTVLTSLDSPDLAEVGFQDGSDALVVRLARLAKAAGLGGVVCSGPDIAPLRRACGDEFILMVPGIRPAGYVSKTRTDDQKRVMTAEQAMELGADHVVIGRPLTQSSDPAHAARQVMVDLKRASLQARLRNEAASS